MIKIVNDPFRTLTEVIQELYPDLEIEAQFNPSIEEAGSTSFPEGSAPKIDISSNIPYYAVIEIFAHEVAHVVAGKEHEHDDVWEAEIGKINDRYNALTLEKAEKYGGTVVKEHGV